MRAEVCREASASALVMEGKPSHTGSVLLPTRLWDSHQSRLDYQVGSSGPAVTAPLCPWTLGGFHRRARGHADECPSVPAPEAAAGASRSQQQGLCVGRKVTKTHTFICSSHPDPDPDPQLGPSLASPERPPHWPYMSSLC